MQKNARNFKLKLKQTSPKRNIIIIVSGIILVMLILAAIFFWPKNRDKVIKIAGGEIVVKERPPLPVKPVIAKVELDPLAPSSLDFIQAQPVLKYPDMMFVKYSYQWYVNGDAVRDGKTNVLDRQYFKKGDAVYCRIKAVRGKIEAEPIDSDEINIGNSPPILNLLPVPSFDVPGEFRYTINAEDHDGDPLSYRLLAPLDRGVVIDRQTGLIKWYIDVSMINTQEEPAAPSTLNPQDESASSSGNRGSQQEMDSESPPLANSVTIIFEVSDTEGASVTGSIELNLAKGSEVPK